MLLNATGRRYLLAACLLLTSFAITFHVACSTTGESTRRLRIGAVLPLSGPAAQYGLWIQEALELARTEINAAGGLRGRKLDIIYEDDQAQPRLAATAMEKLVNMDKVPLVYGSWASSCALAQAPIAERARVVLVAEAIAPALRQAGKYVFRTQPDATLYVEKLVEWLSSSPSVRKVAIFYVNNDFGLAQADAFADMFQRRMKGQVVAREAFSQGASEFKVELAKIASSNPDAVFVPGYTEVGILLRQARELGMRQQFFASVPFENPAIVKAAGGAAEGVIYPHHFVPDLDNPLMQAYQRAYRSRYGRPSEGFAALAYDGLRIIAHVISTVGTDPEGIRTGLEEIKDFPGVTGASSFDSEGDIIKPIFIKTVRDGQFVRFR